MISIFFLSLPTRHMQLKKIRSHTILCSTLLEILIWVTYVFNHQKVLYCLLKLLQMHYYYLRYYFINPWYFRENGNFVIPRICERCWVSCRKVSWYGDQIQTGAACRREVLPVLKNLFADQFIWLFSQRGRWILWGAKLRYMIFQK